MNSILSALLSANPISRSKRKHIFAATALALLLAGCSQGDNPAAPFVPARQRSSAKPASPYTREYYQSVRLLGVQGLKKKVRLGMKSEEVQDILGLPTRHSEKPTTSSLTYRRADGILEIAFNHDAATSIQIQSGK
jgi:hypothetical protein